MKFNFKTILRILLVLGCTATLKVQPADKYNRTLYKEYVNINPTNFDEWLQKVVANHTPLNTCNNQIDVIIQAIRKQEDSMTTLNYLYNNTSHYTCLDLLNLQLPKQILDIIDSETDKEDEESKASGTVKIPLTFAVSAIVIFIGYKTYKYFRN
jgi:hypothetical protein